MRVTPILTVALFAACPLITRAAAIPPQPVTDINAGVANSDPVNIRQVNNKVYFVATDKKGRALFVKTLKQDNAGKPALDGKAKVAVRFRDGVEPDQFVVTGMEDLDFDHAKIFYHVPGFGLYAAAKKVKKVDLAPDNTGFRWLSSLAPFKNSTSFDPNFRAVRLFFSGDDKKATNNQLFISNGTPKGTKPLSLGAPNLFPYGMVDSNGTLFFSTGADGQLWKSDGTAAATAKVTSGLTAYPQYLTASNIGGVFFSSSTDNSGSTRDLFYSDSTPGGTVQLTDGAQTPYGFTPFGGGMLFGAVGNGHGFELWYGDNTQAYELNDINTNSSAGSNPSHFVNAGDEQVYFTATDGTGVKLWRSNGTPSSLTEIRTQSSASLLDVAEIVPVMILFGGSGNLGDRVYFTTGANHALWYVDNSDGDAVAYPVLTQQNNQITNATNLSKFVDNGIYRLYFTTDGAGTEFAGTGTELWIVGNDL